MPPKNVKQPDWNASEKRGYALMTDAEKWKYHTHVYAFRIVYLGMPENVHYWNGDREGKFFDADLIAEEVSKLQRKKDRQDGRAPRPPHPEMRDHPLVRYADPRNDPVVQAQRELIVRLKGLPNWQAVLDEMEQEAIAWPNKEGQPDRVAAYRRSGIPQFCAAWRDRMIRNQLEAKAKWLAEQGVANAQRKSKRWWTAEDLP